MPARIDLTTRKNKLSGSFSSIHSDGDGMEMMESASVSTDRHDTCLFTAPHPQPSSPNNLLLGVVIKLSRWG
jgi:hypothetical protein